MVASFGSALDPTDLSIWPEIWDAMGPVAREKYRVDFDRRLADGLVRGINVSSEDIASLVSALATVANPDIPSMPTCPATLQHRQEITDAIQYFDACVARSVHKKEWQSNKSAQAALDKEWNKVLKCTAWDQSKVREWKDVANEAKRAGKKAHVGRVFEICGERKRATRWRS